MSDEDRKQAQFDEDGQLETPVDDTSETERQSTSEREVPDSTSPSRERLILGGSSGLFAFGVIIAVRWLLASVPYSGSRTTQYAVIFITWTRNSDRLFLEILEVLLFTQFHVVVILFVISGYILVRGVVLYEFTKLERLDSILGLGGVLLFVYLIFQIIL